MIKTFFRKDKYQRDHKITASKVMLSITFVFLLAGAKVSGQSELTKLINYSLEHSRSVKKSNLQVEESRYLRKETIGQGLPQIEASGKYSKMMLDKIEIPASAYTMVPAEYAPLLDQIANIDALYMVSGGIQVTQLLYSQAYIEGLKTTRKTQELYTLLKNKTEEEVIEEVAGNYYQAVSLSLQMKTVEKSLSNLQEMLRIATLNYQNDMVKESSVNRLQVTVTNLEVTRQTIKTGIELQINYIKALAGMPADTTINIDTTLITGNNALSIINPAFSIDNVPSYQVLLKQSEIYNQQVKVAQSKYYPTLAAFGQFNFSSYNTTTEISKWTNMNTIGLNLQVPIFSSGVNHAKVKQAKIKESQLQEDILHTRDMLAVSYNNAHSEYQTALDLLGVQKENRDLAVKVYDQTALQYKEGMASMADLLNVNSDFLQADNSYNQQVLKCKLAEIKMLKATGNLKQLTNNK
jgi:outer membrane protein TolC